MDTDRTVTVARRHVPGARTALTLLYLTAAVVGATLGTGAAAYGAALLPAAAAAARLLRPHGTHPGRSRAKAAPGDRHA